MFYEIALGLTKGLGNLTIRHLLNHIESAEAIFKSSKTDLEAILGTKSKIISAILEKESFARAEEELAFVEKYKIKPLFITDKEYPKRLINCADAPVLLFFKGNADLNKQKVVSVVGTRNGTTYGKQFCDELISNLKAQNVMIVSGLAYGIDVFAHRAALHNDITTIGVLGHGLDLIYPAAHRNVAEQMLSDGGLLTEYYPKSFVDRGNFPKRNRIIAGMADAVIVVEATKTGGALITAEIANSYNKDVFAVPGRLDDEYSEGCNFLIKTNRAHLLTGVEDLEYIMGWKKQELKTEKQLKLIHDLNKDELIVFEVIKAHDQIAIDDLQVSLNMQQSKLAVALLGLEMKSVIVSLPGKIYKVN
ncbi:DNA protecting protein DprA [Pseudopedobacter saltans DSM 12145]|uniref:DNA protecting protein DprA n=1 Tax=Pseudopedobacter saltans (strain ATCC 51119 / DSM 12145 / JCM 21818 / CCUG 39354 / LMG 10337 / NBRC 100064 / NCIMB 13643) TaxID=762903 RepID=F0S8R1_PSESL|nr:DNA-processing protein DprA [Pseudopedobacter saltans]ADY52392.1 DNA protecting protein DprA [Pseudopedobacter saltans DSM 12145]